MSVYILDGAVDYFLDDGLGLIIDLRDCERSFIDWNERISRFFVDFSVHVELYLITGDSFLVVLIKTFVEVVLLACLQILELILFFCNRFYEPLFSILPELH